MLRKGSFFVYFLLFHFCSIAQETIKITGIGQISGTVLDAETLKPIEYATISIVKQNQAKIVSGSISNTQGSFIVKDLPAEKYALKIEAVGYKSLSLDSILIDQNHLKNNLGKLKLQTSIVQLQTIKISGSKKLIENRIDKMVFNAENDISSQGGVATDMLKKIPMVSVDIDGNVSLGGAGGIRFLINGKPSIAYGSSINDVLQAIPASEISKIEVITSPGAKYDSEGLGGIINIILKHNRARGYNASINGSIGTRIENGSINANVRDKNFGMNFFMSKNANLLAATPKTIDRITQDLASQTTMIMDQDGSSDVKRHGGNAGLNLDWTFKKKNSFTASFTRSNYLSISSGANDQLFTTNNANGVLLSQMMIHSLSAGNWGGSGSNISAAYKRSFAKEDRELEILFNTGANSNHSSSTAMQYAVQSNTLNFGSVSYNKPSDRVYEFQIDYGEPLSKALKLNIGGKYSGIHIKSLSEVSTANAKTKLSVNPYLSNSLDYQQGVSALYAELEFSLTKKTDMKIGGRQEHTDINAEYQSVQGQQIKPVYDNFVPSLFLMHRINDDRNIKLNYSRRLRRPATEELNPIVNVSDPKNMQMGNPFLLPQYGNRIELSYNHQVRDMGSFMLQLFYRGSNKDIQPYVKYYPSYKVGDSVYYNVNVSRSENIGIEENWGVNIYADLKVNEKLSFRPNVFYYYRRILNSIDSKYNAYSNNVRSTINITYKINKNLISEFFGNLNSARNEIQGKYPSYSSYSLAFKRPFNNKKGSIGLVANNPFALYIKQGTIISGPNFNSSIIRYIPSRSFGISFSWRFGKLEFKKDKNKDEEGPQGPSNG